MPDVLVCGVINWDTLLFVEHIPYAGEEVKVKRIISVPGGKGANTAVAAAKILGLTKVGIIAMLGSDEIAERQTDILEDEGVDTSCIMRHANISSGQAYVVVDSDGEDMILTHMAANEMMTSKNIIANEKILSAVDKCNMIIIIDPPLDVAANLSTQCKDRGKIVIISPALLTKQHGFPTLRKYMSNADYIILNEQETKSLMSMNNDDDDGSIAACSKLSDTLDEKRIITTRGRKGCIFCYEGKRVMIPTMDLSYFGLEVKSTAGAGDAFVGAFGAFKLEGLDDIESIFLANIAAALKTTREETRGSPTYEDIKHYADHDYVRSLHNQIRFFI
jgi:ribokinase